MGNQVWKVVARLLSYSRRFAFGVQSPYSLNSTGCRALLLLSWGFEARWPPGSCMVIRVGPNLRCQRDKAASIWGTSGIHALGTFEERMSKLQSLTSGTMETHLVHLGRLSRCCPWPSVEFRAFRVQDEPAENERIL